MKTKIIILSLSLMFGLTTLTKAQCSAYAGVDDTACGNIVNLQGSFSHNAGATILWTSMEANVIFSDPTAETTTAMIPGFITPTYVAKFLLTETITASSCVSIDTVSITFIRPPHVECGSAQSACGYTAQLSADTLGSGIQTGVWTSSVPGVIITPDVPGNIESSVNVNASFVGSFYQNSQRPVYFYWIAQNDQGCESSDSVLITFYEIPNAFAGADDSVCGKNYDLLGEFSLNNPIGAWSILQIPLSGSAVDFQPATDPDGEVTVSDYGIYKFIWRESNAGNTSCFDRDTIVINFMEVPQPNAGLDFSVCGPYAELNATNTSGNGYWAGPLNSWVDANAWHDSPQDTNFCPPCYTNPNVVVYYPSENDTATFFWMENNGSCLGYDSLNVFFGGIGEAITLVNAADTVVCGRVFTHLNAQMPAYGLGFWYDDVANTIFYPNPMQTNPDSVKIHTSAFGLHNFYWVTVNGDCRDTSAAVPVWFNGNGGISGNISGLGGGTDYTAGLFVEGSPIVRASASPDALGTYFMQANAGDYYLKVDNDNPSVATGIATTYYGDAWQWSDATVLTVAACDTITADINMYTFSQVAGGVGQISGLVSYDGGEPVENVNVYLQTEPIDELASLQQTSVNGDYSFVNIPIGDYKIHVDIPGLPQVTTYNISITPTDTVFPNINFIVDTTIFKDYGYGIYADSNYVNGIVNSQLLNSVMQLYPVPFNQDLNLVISRDGHFNIEWYDVTGRMYSSHEKDLTTGTNKIDVPVDLPKGVCYVKITEGNTVFVKKLIRE